MVKSTERITKFVVEYKDETGKLEARWHYNYEVFKNGPIMVEEFNLPKKEKRKRKKKD